MGSFSPNPSCPLKFFPIGGEGSHTPPDEYHVALFEWSDRYSVAVPEMDAQHQALVGILNQLHNAMLASKGRDAIEPILLSLTPYVARHFAAEEKLMQAAGYPEFARHKAEHDKLSAEVSKFQRQYQDGKVALTVPLLHFLKSWLKDHIVESDSKYGPYVNRRRQER